MWWLKKKQDIGAQVRTLSVGGVLDEQSFWQIVRTEKERADRSGVPVTVVVFTIGEHGNNEKRVSEWNAAKLCGALRSIARLTDHVGIAGENELGVVLWGTRGPGAHRFVKRLGPRAAHLVSDCKFFIYPVPSKLDGDLTADDDQSLELPQPSSGVDMIERISDVESKIAAALNVETAVVRSEDSEHCDESFGFGYGEDDDSDLPPRQTTGTAGDRPAASAGPEQSGATAATAVSVPTIDSTLEQAGVVGAAKIRDLDSNANDGATDRAETVHDVQMQVTIEPLENLFVFPHAWWKRTLDIFGAVLGLVVLSPVLLATAALIKLTSSGPVLFRQVREGHGGKLFTILKFRTMRSGAESEKADLAAKNEQHGPAFKMKCDPRITPIGGFLRKTCLDELPQLWNVLLGEMTLVGPRPLDYRESHLIARWGRRRLHVMPGLTCIWQVHGKSKVSFNEWMRMDIRYSQKVSFWRDVRLVLATLKQVILRQASH